MENLPTEVIIEVLSKLSITDLNKVCKSNKRIHVICNNNKNIIAKTILKHNNFEIKNTNEAYDILKLLYTFNSNLKSINGHDIYNTYLKFYKNRSQKLYKIKQLVDNIYDEDFAKEIMKKTDYQIYKIYNKFFNNMTLNKYRDIEFKLSILYIKWHMDRPKMPEKIDSLLLQKDKEILKEIIEEPYESKYGDEEFDSRILKLHITYMTGRFELIDNLQFVSSSYDDMKLLLEESDSEE